MKLRRPWFLLPLLALVFVVAVACGEDEEETPTAAPTTPTATTAPTTPTAGTPTAAPTTPTAGTPTAAESPVTTPEITTPSPVSGGLADDQVLRLVMAGEPEFADPQAMQFANDISLVKQLFRGLLYYDHDLNLVPMVATEIPSVENGGVSADGTTVTFTLRDDWTWSDGQPGSAADFEYAVKRLCSPDLAGPYTSFYFNIVGCEAYYTALGTEEAPLTPSESDLQALRDAVGVKAQDDTTLVFTLDHAQPTFLTLTALWPVLPVRQDVVEANPDAWTEPENIVSNGPFVLAEWNHNQNIVFEQSPNWWGEPFDLQRIEMPIIEDEGQEYNTYLAGDLDYSRIPIENVQLVRDDPTLSQENITGSELTTFAWEFNSTREPFTNPLVRKAFGAATDRQSYIDAVRQGVGRPTASWIPPGMPGFNDAIGKEFEFNPENAQQLLAEAGFPDGEGLPQVALTIAESAVGRASAEFLKEQISQNLGVEIDIEVLESKTYQQRYGDSDFQVVLGGWGADYPDPENWLPQLFGTGAGNNQYQYSNPEVDAIFEQAALELDNEKRLALYDEAHRIIIDEDMGIAPIFNRGINFLLKPYVQGLVVTGMDGGIHGDWFFDEVTILEH